MRMNAVLLGLSVLLLLSGCVEAPPATRPPGLSFANLQPLPLNVAKIEVRNDYTPPLRDPNVEHNFSTPPYIAAENLIKRQLVAAGSENVLRVVISDASVVREELPLTRGFWGAIEQEPAERLKAKILLRFEMYNPAAPDIILGHADVIAKRNKTLMENTSIAERDHAYFSLTEDLMDDLNDGLRSVVKSTFGRK